MATTPPPEIAPSQPSQPDVVPTEIDTPAPDIDVPAPQPGADPGNGAQPIGFAPSTMVGESEDRGIGSTAGMTAATGGMAGTSR